MTKRGRGRPAKGREIDASQWRDAAIEVLDERGLDGFTLERVGERVGASVMALYRHFTSRQALLDASADHLLAGLVPSSAVGAVRVAEEASAARALLARHPWLARLLLAGAAQRPPALDFTERVVGGLVQAGLGARQAHAAWQLLVSVLIAGPAQAEARRQAPAVPSPNLAPWPHLAQVTDALRGTSADDMAEVLVQTILRGAAALP